MRAWDSADPVDFRGPLDVTRAATVVLDDDCLIIGWSPAAEALFGYPAAEVLGRTAERLSAAARDTGARLRPTGPREAGTVRSEVFEARRKDGGPLHIATTSCALSDGGSGPAWIIVAADLEELRHWESHQAMLRGLATQSPTTLTIYDTDMRLAWSNVAAQQEVVQPAKYIGAAADELIPAGEVVSEGHPAALAEVMRQVLATGEPVRDLHYRGRPPADPDHDHFWTCSYYRLQDARGESLGVCEEAADITDRYRAQQRLALLVQAGDRIGTTLDVVCTAEQLVEVGMAHFADAITVDLVEGVREGAADDTDAAAGRRVERVAGQPAPGSGAPEPDGAGRTFSHPPGSPEARCLASGRPVLDTPAAAAGHNGPHSRLVVPMRAGDTTLGLVAFSRDRNPDPFDSDERALAGELVARAAVCVDNARRFAREHTAALTLQRSLLPQTLPPQTAVDVAYRYLPADSEAGVGGDWFDVIPLSGARVALVVGDVAGHGLRAAATMGRVRTTVRALARLDLAPDELLARLDDLIGQSVKDWAAVHGEGDEALGTDEAVGMTCLYVIYDPVAGRCTLARAGHPPPAVVDPRTGAVTLPDVPEGAPLGRAGLPFESAEIDLSEGSVVALFTNGLVRTPDHGLDEGLDRLAHVVSRHELPLEELCDQAVAALLPGTVADDAALLMVRTKCLGGQQVTVRELVADPAEVARARADTVRQLSAWQLDELAFTTELIVSELVTNAIRYAAGPIQLRLIRDRTLICEVSDTGHTSPHLRHAAGDDEGGRGLFLVAQMAELWGTRYTSTGKTIWVEQALPDRARVPQPA
ncbi:SpoIIE family protein phosphatase [Streptomyces sp. NPDC018031]|uniref:SpoIIE family protein phosphatase n=1 Tax=Streptomyces sp. NPDC018031 TaxID=3365033 RepID=UPI003798B168